MTKQVDKPDIHDGTPVNQQADHGALSKKPLKKPHAQPDQQLYPGETHDRNS